MALDSQFDRVNWHQLFPLGILLRAVRLAATVRALLLASVALALTALGWWATDWVAGWAFQTPESVELNLVVGPRVETYWPWETEPWLYHGGGTDELVSFTGKRALLQSWELLNEPFRIAFEPGWGFMAFLYLLVRGAWATAVWAFFGGAIARGAAVALARDESLGWGQVLSYARGKWLSIFAAPWVVFLGIGLLAIPLAMLGLIMRIPAVGMLFAGLVFPLALLAAVGMAVLALGLCFGWPLMWATISAEGTDAFDAVSRSFAYVYHRPIHFLFYIAQAVLLGATGWFLVNLFAATVLIMANWGVSWGRGYMALAEPSEAVFALETAGAGLIVFWTKVVFTLAGAFSYSFLFTAATAIYFVLRQQVDATERDEVFMVGAGEFGLPPLEPDSLGVPGVKDLPPNQPPGEGQTPAEG